jgi:hypothetical protein
MLMWCLHRCLLVLCLPVGLLALLGSLLRQAQQTVWCEPSAAHLVGTAVMDLLHLLSSMFDVLTHPELEDARKLQLPWAGQLLQQLHECTVAISLEGRAAARRAAATTSAATAAAAAGRSSSSAAAFDKDSSISSCSSSAADGGSSGDVLNVTWQPRASRYISNISSHVFLHVARAALDEEQSRAFYAPPAITELALQLLAAKCVVMHEQHTQHQRQQQGAHVRQSQQLSKQLRGDRMLLPSPRQWLAELLPSDAFIDAAAVCAATQGAPYCSGGIEDWQANTVYVLGRHLSMFCSSRDGSSRFVNISNSQVLSAAATAVPTHALLQAAVHWQRRYYSLTAEQQQLLAAAEASLSADQLTAEAWTAARSARRQLQHAGSLLELCCELQVRQLRELRVSKQVGKLLLLVKQAGQQLLQGMTLALQCGRLGVSCLKVAPRAAGSAA